MPYLYSWLLQEIRKSQNTKFVIYREAHKNNGFWSILDKRESSSCCPCLAYLLKFCKLTEELILNRFFFSKTCSISYLSHYCDKLLDRNDLREEGFIWTHSFRDSSRQLFCSLFLGPWQGRPNLGSVLGCVDEEGVHLMADRKQRIGEEAIIR